MISSIFFAANCVTCPRICIYIHIVTFTTAATHKLWNSTLSHHAVMQRLVHAHMRHPAHAQSTNYTGSLSPPTNFHPLPLILAFLLPSSSVLAPFPSFLLLLSRLSKTSSSITTADMTHWLSHSAWWNWKGSESLWCERHKSERSVLRPGTRWCQNGTRCVCRNDRKCEICHPSTELSEVSELLEGLVAASGEINHRGKGKSVQSS